MTTVAQPRPQNGMADDYGRQTRGGWIIASAVPTVLTGLHGACYGDWVVDDAGLTFAYARSLATGEGPVLQPGAAPVEGYSNPAWLAILVVGRHLNLFDHGAWFGTPDLVVFPKVVALVCCFGMFACMHAIASTVSCRALAITLGAGTATAAVPSFVIWTMSGLESALFAATVMALAAVLVRATARGRVLDVNTAAAAGVLAAAAALTRPDGITFALAFPIVTVLVIRPDTVRRTLTTNLTALAVFGVPMGAYLAWRLMTFGDYLPNTARAKEQGLPTLTDLSKPAALVDYVGWLTTCVAVAVAAVTLARRSGTQTVVGVLLIPLGLAVANYVMLRPDWMTQYRFATPVWPLTAIIVALSAVQFLRGASNRRRLATVTLATAGAVLTLAGFFRHASEFRADPDASVCVIAQNTGYWVNAYADILRIRDGTLLAVDGGGTALTSRLRFVDLSGLADARIARYWQEDDMPGLRDYLLEEVRPTFVKYFSGWSGADRLAIIDDARFERDYEQLWAGGDWVRHDAVPDAQALAVARQWPRGVLALIDRQYTAVPQVWRCGETLRPGTVGVGAPAPSPITPP
jgi:hypothetical protein